MTTPLSNEQIEKLEEFSRLWDYENQGLELDFNSQIETRQLEKYMLSTCISYIYFNQDEAFLSKEQKSDKPLPTKEETSEFLSLCLNYFFDDESDWKKLPVDKQIKLFEIASINSQMLDDRIQMRKSASDLYGNVVGLVSGFFNPVSGFLLNGSSILLKNMIQENDGITAEFLQNKFSKEIFNSENIIKINEKYISGKLSISQSGINFILTHDINNCKQQIKELQLEKETTLEGNKKEFKLPSFTDGKYSPLLNEIKEPLDKLNIMNSEINNELNNIQKIQASISSQNKSKQKGISHQFLQHATTEIAKLVYDYQQKKIESDHFKENRNQIKATIEIRLKQFGLQFDLTQFQASPYTESQIQNIIRASLFTNSESLLSTRREALLKLKTKIDRLYENIDATNQRLESIDRHAESLTQEAENISNRISQLKPKYEAYALPSAFVKLSLSLLKNNAIEGIGSLFFESIFNRHKRKKEKKLNRLINAFETNESERQQILSLQARNQQFLKSSEYALKQFVTAIISSDGLSSDERLAAVEKDRLDIQQRETDLASKRDEAIRDRDKIIADAIRIFRHTHRLNTNTIIDFNPEVHLKGQAKIDYEKLCLDIANYQKFLDGFKDEKDENQSQKESILNLKPLLDVDYEEQKAEEEEKYPGLTPEQRKMRHEYSTNIEVSHARKIQKVAHKYQAANQFLGSIANLNKVLNLATNGRMKNIGIIIESAIQLQKVHQMYLVGLSDYKKLLATIRDKAAGDILVGILDHFTLEQFTLQFVTPSINAAAIIISVINLLSGQKFVDPTLETLERSHKLLSKQINEATHTIVQALNIGLSNQKYNLTNFINHSLDGISDKITVIDRALAKQNYRYEINTLLKRQGYDLLDSHDNRVTNEIRRMEESINFYFTLCAANVLPKNIELNIMLNWLSAIEITLTHALDATLNNVTHIGPELFLKAETPDCFVPYLAQKNEYDRSNRVPNFRMTYAATQALLDMIFRLSDVLPDEYYKSFINHNLTKNSLNKALNNFKEIIKFIYYLKSNIKWVERLLKNQNTQLDQLRNILENLNENNLTHDLKHLKIKKENIFKLNAEAALELLYKGSNDYLGAERYKLLKMSEQSMLGFVSKEMEYKINTITLDHNIWFLILMLSKYDNARKFIGNNMYVRVNPKIGELEFHKTHRVAQIPMKFEEDENYIFQSMWIPRSIMDNSPLLFFVSNTDLKIFHYGREVIGLLNKDERDINKLINLRSRPKNLLNSSRLYSRFSHESEDFETLKTRIEREDKDCNHSIQKISQSYKNLLSELITTRRFENIERIELLRIFIHNFSNIGDERRYGIFDDLNIESNKTWMIILANNNHTVPLLFPENFIKNTSDDSITRLYALESSGAGYVNVVHDIEITKNNQNVSECEIVLFYNFTPSFKIEGNTHEKINICKRTLMKVSYPVYDSFRKSLNLVNHNEFLLACFLGGNFPGKKSHTINEIMLIPDFYFFPGFSSTIGEHCLDVSHEIFDQSVSNELSACYEAKTLDNSKTFIKDSIITKEIDCIDSLEKVWHIKQLQRIADDLANDEQSKLIVSKMYEDYELLLCCLSLLIKDPEQIITVVRHLQIVDPRTLFYNELDEPNQIEKLLNDNLIKENLPNEKSLEMINTQTPSEFIRIVSKTNKLIVNATNFVNAKLGSNENSIFYKPLLSSYESITDITRVLITSNGLFKTRATNIPNSVNTHDEERKYSKNP